MVRRYTPEEKDHALELLIANNGDLSLTSAETGIPVRTLENWRRAGVLPPPVTAPPPPPMPDDRLEALEDIQQQMLREARNLAYSLREAVADAPLSQRVAALAQLLDRIIKLNTQLPGPTKETVFRIEYIDPEGHAHSTPPIPTEDDEQ
jgi:hypothetical protein